MAQQDLKSRRRRQPAPRQNIRADAGVKAHRSKALTGKARRHTADQRRGALLFLLCGIQLTQVHLAHRVAFRKQADPGLIHRAHRGDRLQIDGRGQNHPALMVRVVAAEFGPAGGGKQQCRRRAEHLGKAFFQSFIHSILSCM